jgi:hypothetical protein
MQLLALGRGELAGPERAALEAHLVVCPDCHAAYQSYQEVAAIVQRLPRLALPADSPARYLHLQPERQVKAAAASNTSTARSPSTPTAPAAAEPRWPRGNMFRGRRLLAQGILVAVTLALVLLLLSKGLPSGLSGPATGLHPTPSPILSLTPAPPFSLMLTSPTNGQVLSQGVQITCTGTYTGPKPPYVWVLLQDTRGQYYLQYPPVSFNPDGSWQAPNVIPGPGISEIAVVQVTSAGNALFEQKASQGDFGAFPLLPADSIALAKVSVQVQ